VTPPAPKWAVLAHDARLDILCCLDPNDPLGVEAVSMHVQRDAQFVKYHLRILDRFQLAARKRRHGEVGPTDYVLRIAQHPDWVVKTVDAHRDK